MHSCDHHDLRSIGWWAGKSSATRRQPAMLWKERLWILAHLPDHNVLACRSGAPATTSYQRNGIVINGKSSLAYPRGPCLQYCLSICGNTWTNALHAAHFELLVSSVQNQVGWSVFLVLYPGQHYVCVCVRTCFQTVLHVSGIYGIQLTSLEHMLASLSLTC